MKRVFCLVPPSENHRLFIIKFGGQCSYSWETKKLFTKLKELGTMSCVNSSMAICLWIQSCCSYYNKIINYIWQFYAMKEKCKHLVATKD